MRSRAPTGMGQKGHCPPPPGLHDDVSYTRYILKLLSKIYYLAFRFRSCPGCRTLSSGRSWLQYYAYNVKRLRQSMDKRPILKPISKRISFKLLICKWRMSEDLSSAIRPNVIRYDGVFFDVFRTNAYKMYSCFEPIYFVWNGSEKKKNSSHQPVNRIIPVFVTFEG